MVLGYLCRLRPTPILWRGFAMHRSEQFRQSHQRLLILRAAAFCPPTIAARPSLAPSCAQAAWCRPTPEKSRQEFPASPAWLLGYPQQYDDDKPARFPCQYQHWCPGMPRQKVCRLCWFLGPYQHVQFCAESGGWPSPRQTRLGQGYRPHLRAFWQGL